MGVYVRTKRRPGPRFLALSSFRGDLYSNETFKEVFFVQISSRVLERLDDRFVMVVIKV